MKKPGLSPKSPTAHSPRHKVGKMELGHEPSGHATKILRGAISGSGNLVGENDDFASSASNKQRYN